MRAGRIASPHSAILLFRIEGALNELPAGHSPAGNRDAAYVLNIAGSWEGANADAINMAWARDCFEATRSCSTGGTDVNFLTEEEGRGRIAAAYSRADLGRLAEIKRRYDPENLFRHTKSIAGQPVSRSPPARAPQPRAEHCQAGEHQRDVGRLRDGAHASRSDVAPMPPEPTPAPPPRLVISLCASQLVWPRVGTLT